MKEKYIEVKGAKVNNLKNIDVRLPHNKMTIITGVSGSGKSSLAFDTLYAEGQRRYVESLSSYARQFLGRMQKPEVDYIKNLPPAIAIEQRVQSRNPRSTVGTTTEIYEYLRLLFASIGHTYSPISGQEVHCHQADDVVRQAMEFAGGTKMVLLAPMAFTAERDKSKQLELALQNGFTRIYIKGDFQRIEDVLGDSALLNEQEEMYLVVDRFTADNSKELVSRVSDSAETAFYEGDGACRLMVLPSRLCYDFSTRFEADGMSFVHPTDNLFSFNSPLGACTECEGFGSVIGIDERLVIPDSTLSVYDGCVQCWHGDKMKVWKEEFCRRAAKDDFPIFTPYLELTTKQRDMLWHGLPSDKCRPKNEQVSIDAFFEMVKENQYKIQYRVMMSRYRGRTICPVCHGTRLKPEASWVKISGMAITDLVQFSIENLSKWFDNLQLSEHESRIAARPLQEIRSRLRFLLDVGLGYLTLGRQTSTLSGGESQRVTLSTSLGSPLVGSLYILDEPSIGLHNRDTSRLIKVLHELRDEGNTIVVVEHDEDVMRSSDYLVDVGPNAGRLGGEIVFTGDPSEVQHMDRKVTEQYHSHTIDFLSGKDKMQLPASRRSWNRSIMVHGARMNNLKGIDVTFPLNVLCVVTGVSGSGKSSLVKGILYPALKRMMDEVADAPGEYQSLDGDLKALKHVEFVSQDPIGKSTRSNPATYVKAYDEIRKLFAQQALSKQMGYAAQHFSFNAEGGRCEECKGAGVITIEMQFMADLELTCEACHGKRFKKEILDVRYHEKNINDVLEMTIDEAISFFEQWGNLSIVKRLKPLSDVGLGYIKLGQSSSTLSGGENQRVKLAYFMGTEKQASTLFIFDEPTTGLHYHDIKRLIAAFNALIERGHSILVVEHNVEVMRQADYIIDLGPEGGDKGGWIVAHGTPEEVSANVKSITGRYLQL